MEYIELIDKINLMSDETFTNWYNTMIQYNTGYTDEEKIFRIIITDSTNDKYYKLFNHFKNYDESIFGEYKDLLNIIIEDKEYYIQKAKKDLINKISTLGKLYNLTIRTDRNTFILIVKENKKQTYKQTYYDSTKDLEIEYSTELIEYIMIKYNIVKDYEKIIFTGNKIMVKRNKNNAYYDLEFKNGGMLNYHFEDCDISITKI
jgi:hypothetical protein